MKYAIYALIGLMGVNAMADGFLAPQTVKCTVTQLIPEHANFFNGPGPRGPQVGETIELDLTAKEITDLTFSNKGTIPVKKAKAALVKKAELEPYQSYFEGTAKTMTSDYIGMVSLYHGEKQSEGFIQVMRKPFFEAMVLNQLNLKCDRIK